MSCCKGIITDKETGKTRNCRIDKFLDVRGFCKYHQRQGMTKCLGIKNNGENCKMVDDLDDNGYCKFHIRQGILKTKSYITKSQIDKVIDALTSQ